MSRSASAVPRSSQCSVEKIWKRIKQMQDKDEHTASLATATFATNAKSLNNFFCLTPRHSCPLLIVSACVRR